MGILREDQKLKTAPWAAAADGSSRTVCRADGGTAGAHTWILGRSEEKVGLKTLGIPGRHLGLPGHSGHSGHSGTLGSASAGSAPAASGGSGGRWDGPQWEDPGDWN